VATVSPRELEERLLAEELRELQQRRAESAPVRDRGADAVAVAQEIQHDLEELSADDLLVDEPDSPPESAPHPLARLGLGEFDDDSEVKPVVLLSPKRKPAAAAAAAPVAAADGAFMSDLERRLREDEN